MDILGYQSLHQEAEDSGTQAEFLESLHGALLDGRNWLEDRTVDEAIEAPQHLFDKDRHALKAFSDNIVIGWPIRQDAESELGDAFDRLACFQLSMANAGFFVRGAISVGHAYIDDIVVSGKALIEAYEGESQLARDPRIILTRSAEARVQTHLRYYRPREAAPQTRDLLIDSDGRWFVNYLNAILVLEDYSGPFDYELTRHKQAVETQLAKYKGTPTIFAKYAWVAGYHNYFCDLHSHYFTDEYKIETDLFRSAPRLVVE
ncbi:MAG: hypothetical protein OXF11_08480 [Deltaproteobacteria bacterium]|nr:hypothetical protein [Deltaproteobacteria bacterium]